ncbi:MAG: hypothetical protein ACLSHC_09340 [Bilophila wadsworthia]
MQLTSFGCGLDAITADQCRNSSPAPESCIRHQIDEGSSARPASVSALFAAAWRARHAHSPARRFRLPSGVHQADAPDAHHLPCRCPALRHHRRAI